MTRCRNFTQVGSSYLNEVQVGGILLPLGLGVSGMARSSIDLKSEGAAGRLGTRLRHTRQMRGMTLKAVAAEAQCSESLLSKVENLSLIHI